MCSWYLYSPLSAQGSPSISKSVQLWARLTDRSCHLVEPENRSQGLPNPPSRSGCSTAPPDSRGPLASPHLRLFAPPEPSPYLPFLIEAEARGRVTGLHISIGEVAVLKQPHSRLVPGVTREFRLGRRVTVQMESVAHQRPVEIHFTGCVTPAAPRTVRIWLQVRGEAGGVAGAGDTAAPQRRKFQFPPNQRRGKPSTASCGADLHGFLYPARFSSSFGNAPALQRSFQAPERRS